jgi:hypothetical protein
VILRPELTAAVLDSRPVSNSGVVVIL